MLEKIPETFLNQILRQAETEYPRECCGVILGLKSQAGYSRVVAARNLQDEYHEKDPAGFPRTSRIAYFLDPLQLLKLQKEIRSSGECIKVIYHSHIDAPAVFSEEDRNAALADGVPVYPEADYLVLSLFQGKTREAALYRWERTAFKPVFVQPF